MSDRPDDTPPPGAVPHGERPRPAGDPGPADDPRRAREFRADDRWVDPRQRHEMPFLEHLDELRHVLFHSLAAIAVGAVAGWLLSPRVMADLIARTVKVTVVMSPFEALNERLKLTLILGVLIAGPLVFWRLWSFVVPGLLKRERGWALPLALGSYTLFVTGCAASYFYLTPLVIRVLDQFLTPGMVAQIRLSFLLDFLYNLCLACGLLMQLPLVTMLLTAMGLVSPGFLLRQWRVAVVIVFVVTAAVTPGDVVSAQIIMGVPMVVLYFASVGLSFLVARRRPRAASAEDLDAPEAHEPNA